MFLSITVGRLFPDYKASEVSVPLHYPGYIVKCFLLFCASYLLDPCLVDTEESRAFMDRPHNVWKLLYYSFVVESTLQLERISLRGRAVAIDFTPVAEGKTDSRLSEACASLFTFSFLLLSPGLSVARHIQGESSVFS